MMFFYTLIAISVAFFVTMFRRKLFRLRPAVKFPTAIYPEGQYQPSALDALAVKSIILRKKLPLELVDICLDLAEYWPHTSSVTPPRDEPLSIHGTSRKENLLVVRSYPLGYVPDGRDEILLDYPVKYNTLESKPDQPPSLSDSYSEMTNDVLAHWATQSCPRSEFPCRKIIITIKSHDQGWGGQGRGRYTHSNTWFDYGIERLAAFRGPKLGSLPPWASFRVPLQSSIGKDANNCVNATKTLEIVTCSLRTIRPSAATPPLNVAYGGSDSNPLNFAHPLHPSEDRVLQKNKTAVGDTQTNIIKWSWKDNIHPESKEGDALVDNGRGRDTLNGQVVRNLRVGDTITVWGKARFGAWTNMVEEVGIDIYWAV